MRCPARLQPAAPRPGPGAGTGTGTDADTDTNTGVWWCVAIYTFVSTAVAAYASDSIVPWITNTVQDHKTQYIPYSKFVCLCIIQIFTCYAVIMSVIGLFVALSQVPPAPARLSARAAELALRARAARRAGARALTAGHAQVDFMLIRLVADLVVNYFTTRFFLHDKTVNLHKYEEHNRRPDHGGDSGD